MITSIRLINWKSFEDATLYIDPLTVLIGANASGKSNVLDALEFLQMFVKGTALEQIANDVVHPLRGGRDWLPLRGKSDFAFQIFFEREGIKWEYYFRVKVQKNDVKIANEYVKDLHNDSYIIPDMREGTQVNLNYSILALSWFSKILGSEKGWLKKEYEEGISQLMGDLSAITVFKPNPRLMRKIGSISDVLDNDGSNIAGFLANHPEKNKIEKKITECATILPEGDILQVWAESFGQAEPKAELYCKEKWGDSDPVIVSADNMSDGTLRFIAVLVAVLTAPKGSLLAVEEIDNGLHPSRAELLVKMLRELGKERGVDLLIVTHNPALLNALGPESIPFISVVHRKKSGVSDITLLEDIDDLPLMMASGPLGNVVSQGRIQKALQKQDELENKEENDG